MDLFFFDLHKFTIKEEQVALSPTAETLLKTFNQTNINHHDDFANTCLHLLCMGDHCSYKNVSILLSFLPDLSIWNSRGMTVLDTLCSRAEIEEKILELLLVSGCNPMQEGGQSALIHLLGNRERKNECELIVLLVEHGADPNFETRNKLTPLLCALSRQSSSVDVVKKLIEVGSSTTQAINIFRSNKMLPIHYLCSGMKTNFQIIENNLLTIQVLELLNPNKESVGKGNKKKNEDDQTENQTVLQRNTINNCLTQLNKDTILHCYLQNPKPNVAVLKYFDKLGLDPNLRNNKGRNCLHTLCNSKHIDNLEATVLLFLCQKIRTIDAKDTSKSTPLMLLVQSTSRFDLFEILIKYKADIFVCSPNGENLLHLCMKGKANLKIIEYLIANGTDISQTDSFGNTALMLAKKLDFKLLEYFVNKGAIFSKSTTNRNLVTLVIDLLSIETHLKDSNIIKKFFNSGLDWNKLDKDGRNYLNSVCSRKPNPSIIKILLESNSDPNNLDSDFCSPLINLITNPNITLDPESLRLLIMYGADLQLTDGNDWSPVHYICWSYPTLEHFKILALGNFDFNLQDFSGWSPLYIISHSLVDKIKKYENNLSGEDSSSDDNSDDDDDDYEFKKISLW
ncbi:ankyrin repeat-containing protein [Anaeramoeba flamelloides]|uniref:Ankyrin repeat-containing protein n=1 Tax=Anaeramoeba flamelloides TaxID=1746091 RepID=A0AAV8A1C9_9EUKA|nr:ankyrin repeat-containing protein [Anaeramoeba flamelloides]